MCQEPHSTTQSIARSALGRKGGAGSGNGFGAFLCPRKTPKARKFVLMGTVAGIDNGVRIC